MHPLRVKELKDEWERMESRETYGFPYDPIPFWFSFFSILSFSQYVGSRLGFPTRK